MLLSTLLLSLLTAPAAQAQDVSSPEVNSQLFRPSVDGHQSLWLNDAAVGPSGQLTSRLLLQWVNDPLVYRTDDGTDTVVVDDVSQLDLLAGYALGPVRIGLDVPMYLRANGLEGGETGLGDLALDLKGRILADGDAPLGLALGARLGLPTSTVATSLGSPGAAIDLGLMTDKRFGRTTLLANLGTRALPETELENVTLNDQLSYGLGVGLEASKALTLSTEFVGHGAYGAWSNPAANPAEILPGFALRPGGGDLVVRSAVGLPLSQGIGAPKMRVLLAIALEPPLLQDQDGDGLTDDVDACPLDQEDFDQYRDDDGCPDPTQLTLNFVDTDGTAIFDVTSTVGEATAKGTHEIALAPGDYPVSAEAQGFMPHSSTLVLPPGPPYAQTIELQMLPGMLVITAVGPKGENVPARVVVKGTSYDLNGALELQRDPGMVRVDITAEGYLSRRLPAEVRGGETTRVEVVLQPALAEVTRERIDIKESVYFETAKAVIKPESYALLDQVATILVDHPEITRLKVEGHTDNRGDAAYNLKLSSRRAASVVDYLVRKGVNRDRLASEGFGESKPLDPANNTSAWTKNRRVDFFILEREDETDP